MKKSQLKQIIKEEIQSILKESLSKKSKINAIKALAGHLKAAQSIGDEEVNTVLAAIEDIKKSTSWTDVMEILGQFGFDDDEIESILGPYTEGLQEANENPASNMLSLLAAPDFKKYMDRLSDMVDDNDFMAIKGLYDKLYNELKKHEGLQEGYGSVKPIKTFKVTALAKIFKSLGFPVKKVETYNNINAGPTLSIEFVNTLKDENEFIDAYHDFQYTGGVGRMLPNIESAYHKGGNKWDFQTEA